MLVSDILIFGHQYLLEFMVFHSRINPLLTLSPIHKVSKLFVLISFAFLLHCFQAVFCIWWISFSNSDCWYESKFKLKNKCDKLFSCTLLLAAGTPDDKIRLFIINLICGPPLSDVSRLSFCCLYHNSLLF